MQLKLSIERLRTAIEAAGYIEVAFDKPELGGYVSTSAVGDSGEIASLLFKVYARANIHRREIIIDLLDSMLKYNAHGVESLTGSYER